VGQTAWSDWNAWKPQWRDGYGPLMLAPGVQLVGEAGSIILSEVR